MPRRSGTGCATTRTSSSPRRSRPSRAARGCGACPCRRPRRRWPARRAAHRMGRRAAWVSRRTGLVGARGRGARRQPRHAVPRRQERRRLRAAEAPLDRIHRELKKAFDPSGVFNPGRMYPASEGDGCTPGPRKLLLAQSAGEALVQLAGAPLPGPVLGLLLMLVALRWEAVRRSVGAAADVLLAHLAAVRAGGRGRDDARRPAHPVRRAHAAGDRDLHLGRHGGDGAGAARLAAARLKPMQSFVELWVYLSATPLFRADRHARHLRAGAALDARRHRLGRCCGRCSRWLLLPPAARPTDPGCSSSTSCSGRRWWPNWRCGRWQRRPSCVRAAVLLAATAGGRPARRRGGPGLAARPARCRLRSLAPKSVTAPVAGHRRAAGRHSRAGRGLRRDHRADRRHERQIPVRRAAHRRARGARLRAGHGGTGIGARARWRCIRRRRLPASRWACRWCSPPADAAAGAAHLTHPRDRSMQTPRSLPSSRAPARAPRPRPSCASACTAASAPPPAPPTSCSATSSTAARTHLPFRSKQVLEGAGDERHAVTTRPLPDLPQLREHLPQACSTATWSTSAARSQVEERRAPGWRARRALAAQGGLTSPLFAPGDEARPAAAPAAAGGAADKVPAAAPPAHRWPTREHRAQGADADGLRAAGDDAQHQQRHRARARRRRHPDPGGRRRRLLRRDPFAPERHQDGGLADMRRNIDAWWPLVSAGKVEAIVMNASGCGVTGEGHGPRAGARPAYAERARASASSRGT